MTGPAGGVHHGRGGPEHPIDVAMRTAFGGAPLPRHPSRWSTWGWRALLVLPGVLVIFAVPIMAAAPPRGPHAVSAAVDIVTLAVVMTVGWWVAGQPSLDPTEARQLRSQLGRANHREVSRALRRGQPVAPELRPWAAAVLHQQQRAMLPVFAVVLGAVGTSLRTATGQRAPSGIPPALAATLSVVTAILVLIGVAYRWWIHRRAVLLGLPLQPPT